MIERHSLRCADFFASSAARRALRSARTYRGAAKIAAAHGAPHAAVRSIRALMRNFALVAVAEARRTRALHTRPESEIGQLAATDGHALVAISSL